MSYCLCWKKCQCLPAPKKGMKLQIRGNEESQNSTHEIYRMNMILISKYAQGAFHMEFIQVGLYLCISMTFSFK